mmetsp:Transcript_60472/g.197919  ORF Transcript_60472/g.197919 Transcript_60472/m.197919 type:complete len:168 (-) Transcript_60472:338-841(-)
MSADANLGTVGKVIEAVCIVLTTIGFITGVSWSSRYQTEGRSADEPQPGEGRRRVGGAGKDGKAALVKNVRLEAIAKAAIGAGRLPSISEGPLPKRPERTRSAAVTVPEASRRSRRRRRLEASGSLMTVCLRLCRAPQVVMLSTARPGARFKVMGTRSRLSPTGPPP